MSKISEATYKKLDSKVIRNKNYIASAKKVDSNYSNLKSILLELEPLIAEPNIKLILNLVDEYACSLNELSAVEIEVAYKLGGANNE